VSPVTELLLIVNSNEQVESRHNRVPYHRLATQRHPAVNQRCLEAYQDNYYKSQHHHRPVAPPNDYSDLVNVPELLDHHRDGGGRFNHPLCLPCGARSGGRYRQEPTLAQQKLARIIRESEERSLRRAEEQVRMIIARIPSIERYRFKIIDCKVSLNYNTY
jgi:hypothetical protein